MARDKKKKSSDDDDLEENQEEEMAAKKDKKKKKKKHKHKDEDADDDDNEEETGRKSRKDKKKKKKKKKESEEEESEEDTKPRKRTGGAAGRNGRSSTEDERKSDSDDTTSLNLPPEPKGDKGKFESTQLFKILTAEKEFSRESPKQVKKLLEEGVDVNLRGEFCETYLHALMGPKPPGTESAVLAVLYQLTEAGLDVNAKDSEGFTPLHISVLNDLSPRLVNALLKVGADPCALNSQDQDAMDLCEVDTIRDVLEYHDMGLWRQVAAGEAAKVRALVNSWCKIDQRNDQGTSLMQLANKVGNEYIIETLKEFEPKNAVVNAALSGNQEKLEKAVKKEGVDLNIRDWSYTRPSDGKRTHRPLLAECVSLGWFECARLLVKKGADVNFEVEVMEGKKEPLFMYLFYLMAPQKLLDVELFRLVLKKADLSLVQDHYTLLYQCWQMNVSGDLVVHMVDSGLQLETRDDEGYTVRDRILMDNYESGIKGNRAKLREALYYVDQSVIHMATSGNVERLESLASNGYDYINVANLKGKSIKRLAKKEEQAEVEKFLDKLPEFQRRSASIQNGIIKGNLQEVRDNLSRRLSRARDRNGRTVLQQAVLLERRFIIKHVLKEFPKTINLTDSGGRTALHYASAISEATDIEDALLAAGADPTAPDKEGKTPKEYQTEMGMNFIINERNKEAGADTFLLDRYISLLYAIEDEDGERVSQLIQALPAVYSVKDFDRMLPSRFPKLQYRPLPIAAVDEDQEDIAIILVEAGVSHYVAGKFRDMDEDRTTMSLEEAAEKKNMHKLLDLIKEKRAGEGEGRRADVALRELLHRDSVAFSQTEYQRGNTPDSLKSGSLPAIGEEYAGTPQPKKRGTHNNGTPASNNRPQQQQQQQQRSPQSDSGQQSSTCVLL